MTYKVQGRRAAQQDTYQPTQMTRQRQLGGSGGTIPPGQRTLLGAADPPGPYHQWGNNADYHDSTHGTKKSKYY